jgi:predicted phosphodiesterase
MKIGIVSDNHGRPFSTLGNIDLLFHAGDFYGHEKNPFGQWETIQPGDLGIACPVYAVKGNHDYADPANFFSGSRDLSEKCQQIAPGLFVVGVGWHGERFYDLPNESDIEPVCKQALEDCGRKMIAGDRSILLSHYGVIAPDAVATHVNSVYSALTRIALVLKPALIVQGHVHEWAGMSCFYAGATCIFAGPEPVVINLSE